MGKINKGFQKIYFVWVIYFISSLPPCFSFVARKIQFEAGVLVCVCMEHWIVCLCKWVKCVSVCACAKGSHCLMQLKTFPNWQTRFWIDAFGWLGRQLITETIKGNMRDFQGKRYPFSQATYQDANQKLFNWTRAICVAVKVHQLPQNSTFHYVLHFHSYLPFWNFFRFYHFRKLGCFISSIKKQTLI